MIPILPRSGNHLEDNYDDLLEQEESNNTEREVEDNDRD